MSWPETPNHGTYGEIESSEYSIKLVNQIILTFKPYPLSWKEKPLWESEVFICVPFDLGCVGLVFRW